MRPRARVVCYLCYERVLRLASLFSHACFALCSFAVVFIICNACAVICVSKGRLEEAILQFVFLNLQVLLLNLQLAHALLQIAQILLNSIKPTSALSVSLTVCGTVCKTPDIVFSSAVKYYNPDYDVTEIEAPAEEAQHEIACACCWVFCWHGAKQSARQHKVGKATPSVEKHE